MFSLTFLTRRLPDITLEQFVDHYRGTHFSLGSQLPGLVSYQQSLLIKDHEEWAVAETLTGWDALSVYTFDSLKAAEDAFASDAGKALNEDTGLFMEWESVLSLPAGVVQRWEAGKGPLPLDGEHQ